MFGSNANRELGLRINKEIWNEQRFENIPHYFTEDFVADYSPRVVRKGRDQIEEMVRAAHRTFEGFKEEVHHIIADDSYVVVHFYDLMSTDQGLGADSPNESPRPVRRDRDYGGA